MCCCCCSQNGAPPSEHSSPPLSFSALEPRAWFSKYSSFKGLHSQIPLRKLRQQDYKTRIYSTQVQALYRSTEFLIPTLKESLLPFHQLIFHFSPPPNWHFLSTGKDTEPALPSHSYCLKGMLFKIITHLWLPLRINPPS